jgi:antitoxin component YwqK of YwqJK toxin-antitoxin module
MYKIIIKLIVFILFLNEYAFSQNDCNKRDSLGRKQGIWYGIRRTLKGNTYLDAIESYKNDRLNGKQTLYYENGKIMSVCFMINDTINGERKVYRETGVIFQIINYKMGKEHGTKEFYDYDGNLESQQEYKEGILDGFDKRYAKSGRLESETNWLNNVEHGTRTIYADNEAHNIIREIDFVNGELIKSRHYKNGKLVKED